MALPLFKEKRLSFRRTMTGLLPGRLTTGDGVDFECQPKDVSENGLGVLSKTILPVGAKVDLTIRDLVISMEVAWAQPGFGKKDLIRYGLVVKDSSHNLEKIFIDSGCMK